MIWVVGLCVVAFAWWAMARLKPPADQESDLT